MNPQVPHLVHVIIHMLLIWNSLVSEENGKKTIIIDPKEQTQSRILSVLYVHTILRPFTDKLFISTKMPFFLKISFYIHDWIAQWTVFKI